MPLPTEPNQPEPAAATDTPIYDELASRLPGLPDSPDVPDNGDRGPTPI